MPATRAQAHLRVEPCGLSREVVAFGEAGSVPPMPPPRRRREALDEALRRGDLEEVTAAQRGTFDDDDPPLVSSLVSSLRSARASLAVSRCRISSLMAAASGTSSTLSDRARSVR